MSIRPRTGSFKGQKIRRITPELKIDVSAARCIPPLFRPPFLKAAVEGRHRKHLKEVLSIVGIPPAQITGQDLKGVLDCLYNLLVTSYRCEYVFKNIIANALFLDLHDPAEALLTGEFRSGESRADVVILNGTSSVYEIKTEYDSFVKLPSQLSDYRKIFDRIWVVVPDQLVSSALKLVDEGTGLLGIGEKLQITTIREPISNKSNTSPSQIFDCMRKSEYTAIIHEVTGAVPNVSNGLMFGACKSIFQGLEPSSAHDLMVRHVKRRSNNAISSLLSATPSSLAHLCLSLKESKTCLERILLVLNSRVDTI